jgi:hypothetical protein
LEEAFMVEEADLEEVVTEEVELVDLEVEAAVLMQEVGDLEAVGHKEDLVDLEVVDMAEADWEEVASVAVGVNQVLAVQAIAVLLGEAMAVVDLEA